MITQETTVIIYFIIFYPVENIVENSMSGLIFGGSYAETQDH